ncbi:MAG: CoA transferase [Burkholderiales bacterium]
MAASFIDRLLVVELGDRPSTGLCGALLQRLGADVVMAEPGRMDLGPDSKWHHRALLAAGKQSLVIDYGCQDDTDRLASVLERADVALVSSDWMPALPQKLRTALDNTPILCDLTAFGSSGPMAGSRHTDAMLQAFSGLMDTTGSSDGPPTLSQVPLTEGCAAAFAAAGILAAVRSRSRYATQRVEVALFDTAVSMLSTFLPAHFVGDQPTRIGNRHTAMSPWNAYRARDGWVLVCSASTDMWRRVCDVIERADLKADPRFAAMSGRVALAAEVDAAVQACVGEQVVSDCVQRFSAAGIACGPVYEVGGLFADPNLLSRKAFARLRDPQSGSTLTVPAAPIQGSRAGVNVPRSIPAPHRGEFALPPRREAGRQPAAGDNGEGALAGVRVLEMGSYTTSPLAARNLAALGAYVVKAEPQAGELSRASPPHADGQSYFCTLSNSDKRCVIVDLQSDSGKTLFRELLRKSDVFIENMKPGVLARHGFGPGTIGALNPRLVYCSVSGFGDGAPLGGRPAMDTTIQGMAGLMDLTRQADVPHKTGISTGDLLGGQFALVAILAGLEYRERTGEGQYIDLSMQEISAWLTQFDWNGERGGRPEGATIRCSDGYVYAEGPVVVPGGGKRRSEMVEALAAQGVRAVPVQTVSEVALHPQTVARALIVQGRSVNGKAWPLLASPIRLSPAATRVHRAIGAVGADLDEVLRDWDIRLDAAVPAA